MSELSLDAKLCLTKMGLIYERVEGVRFKLSDISSIVSLINSSLEAVNDEYKKYFEAFLSHLTNEQIDDLREQGAIIYRGATPAPESQEPPVSNPAKKPLFYRGQKINPEREKTKVATEEAPKVKKKSKRIYRGMVIED